MPNGQEKYVNKKRNHCEEVSSGVSVIEGPKIEITTLQGGGRVEEKKAQKGI